MIVGRRLLIAALLLLPASLAPAAETASRCTPAPLLQPGKTQLLERVLVRPGATLSPKPDGTGGKTVPAFTALFVYARSPDGHATQVGASSACKPEGWIASDHLALWRHTMVAAFTPRAARARVLFFGNPEVPKSVLQTPDSQKEAVRLDVAAQKDPRSANIVAEEPETPVDINKQFYLLPILDAQGARFVSSNLPVKILHVASLALPAVASPSPAPPGANKGPATHAAPATVRHNFRTAVVFVLDATRSMDPYLDRSRQAIDKILGQIEKENLTDRVRFGLVAFRDDPKAVPKIEYGTRVYADPNTVATRAEFDRAVTGLRAAKVSSRAVAEDAYAGMETAIDKIDWSGFDGRFIVLVTDASAREPNSHIVSTRLDEGALAVLAREKGIALLTVHLLTKEGGAADHTRAEHQYRAMTAYPGRGSLYYPVPAGDVAEFGARAEAIGTALVHLIENAEDTGGTRPDTPAPLAPVNATAPKLDPKQAQADIAAVGYAMRMAYLGRVEGSAAPTMFESWAMDRDIAHNDVQSLDVRVLMSKSQLSDLAATISALYEAFQKGLDDPSDLAGQLRSALLTLSRDPNKIGSGANKDLTSAALDEYLGGLPFQSTVMKMDQETWISMSPGDQEDLIDHLAVDLELYRHMQDDVSHWVKLAPDAPPEDAVYPVPLNALP